MTHRRLHREDPEQRRPARGPAAAAGAGVAGSRTSCNWWESMGPTLPTEDVYLRTAVNVGREGWAHFGHVRDEGLPLGHLPGRARPGPAHRVRRAQGRAGLAEGAGRVPRRPAAADRHPGRHRAGQRRAAAQPRRHRADACTTCATCSRSTSRRAGTCGRWSTCCTRYFGREGREEAEELLHRNSGSEDAPRILGAFNEETPDWLSFFMFTYFTDRDGKYQLGTLKESAFDPL